MGRRLAIRHAIRWGIPILVVVLALVYGFISFMIASGITKYERRSQEDHPTAYGLPFEDVEFLSRGGDVILSGWYIPGENGRRTIIMIHGIGGVRSGDDAVDLASHLVAHGFSILMFDFRGHGSSEGEFISAGYFERQDVLGAFDFLITQGIPSECIGLLGFSMGGATAILSAAEEPAICALVVDSPYAKVSELIAKETARKTFIPELISPMFIPGVKVMTSVVYGIHLAEMVPEEVVKLLPYPIMVIHGKADTMIPFNHGVRVHQAAHPESVIWLVPGVDHIDAFVTYPEEYVERLADYFNKQIGIE